MKRDFGILPDGAKATLYTLTGGGLTATVTDYGAHLVSVMVPDKNGNIDDVVLGFDDANGYRTGNGGFLGATVGRNANRIKGASFILEDTRIRRFRRCQWVLRSSSTPSAASSSASV